MHFLLVEFPLKHENIARGFLPFIDQGRGERVEKKEREYFISEILNIKERKKLFRSALANVFEKFPRI